MATDARTCESRRATAGRCGATGHGVVSTCATVIRLGNLPLDPHRRSCTCEADQPSSSTFGLIYGSFTVEVAAVQFFELSLPELLHISISSSSMPANFAAIASLLESESRRPGALRQAIVNRLCSCYWKRCERLPTTSTPRKSRPPIGCGWCDPEIGGALSLIHSRPEQPWTVQSLAGQIHMSRSAFAECFRQLVGNSPLQYLTKCRMQKAGRMLRETELGVKEIASLSGYESVTSFNSAFKRQTGTSPAAFRKRDVTLV